MRVQQLTRAGRVIEGSPLVMYKVVGQDCQCPPHSGLTKRQLWWCVQDKSQPEVAEAMGTTYRLHKREQLSSYMTQSCSRTVTALAQRYPH